MDRWEQGLVPDRGNPRTGRLIFVDVLNILACFAVVILHVSLNVFSPDRSWAWARAVGLQAVGIFAVPVFFMISGMNLLGYRRKYTTAVFFRKRLLRVGRALLLGSLVCYVLLCLFPNSFYGGQSFAGAFGLVDFTKRFLTNSINDVYWFLYSIIYLYMLTPLLSMAVDNRRMMQYLIGLTALVGVGLPFIEWLGLDARYFDTLFGWPLFASSALLYFLVGYYVTHFTCFERMRTGVWFAVAVASTMAMALIGLWVNGAFGSTVMPAQYDNYPIGVTSPLCVVQAVALFKSIEGLEPWLRRHSARMRRIIAKLSGASLGVYLFHILFINWSADNRLGVFWAWAARFPILRALLVYALTLCVVLAGRQLIALGKRLISGSRRRSRSA